jgi:transposase
MWTKKNRKTYQRVNLRYPSDLTSQEWSSIEPLIPPAKSGGNKRTVDLREVVNALMYVLETGCQWRHLPKDFPPRSTVHDYLQLWSWDGTILKIHDCLYAACRELAEKDASPTAAIIDSKTVRSSEKGGQNIDTVGYDAAKLTKGVKYHILVDTLGLLLLACVHPGNIQDHDGAVLLLNTETRALWPFIVTIFADSGYKAAKLALHVLQTGSWRLEIVKRSEGAKGFEVIHKRWIVERTLAWLTRCRRLARNFECLARTSLAFIHLAMIKLMARRIARQ